MTVRPVMSKETVKTLRDSRRSVEQIGIRRHVLLKRFERAGR